MCVYRSVAEGRLEAVVDLSGVERAHWVLVVMDQFTRPIVGFGVHRGAVDGAGLCRMFTEPRAATPRRHT